MIWDVIGAVLLLGGSALTLVAAVGMYRYRDLMTRQHVATKPQVLSLILFLMGAACLVRDPAMTWTMVLVCLLQLITSPILAHLLSRAAYRNGLVDSDALITDELREDLHVVDADGSKHVGS